jgi:DNA-3-methyladenine glycosylase
MKAPARSRNSREATASVATSVSAAAGVANGPELTGDFFARPTVAVARALIGAEIWVASGTETVAGRVVETEAYAGREDPASHAGTGVTPRSAIMFGPYGVAYVYLIYGVHHCLNFVTESEGRAGAVLIRALEPLAGKEAMARRRGGKRTGRRLCETGLCNGPGKLCQACGIDLAWNGLKIGRETDSQRRLWCRAGPAPRHVLATPRIGIRRARARLWRFVDPDSRCLSRAIRSDSNKRS